MKKFISERIAKSFRANDAAKKWQQVPELDQNSRSYFPNHDSSDYPIQRKASCACGGGCPDCQAKSSDLKISQPNDPAEIEADQIADQVMRMPVDKETIGADIASLDNSEEKPQIQRLSNDGGGEITSDIKNGLGSGLPLDPVSRAFFEPRFGHDLGEVRIHNGPQAASAAASVEARAFTLGHNVVFAAGEHDPGSESGKRLLAHELVHVVQQGQMSSGAAKGGIVQRTPNPIDSQAQTLIDLAQDTSVAIDQRAQNLITQMLAAYYPADVGKFTRIDWVEDNAGLTAVCPSTGTATTTCTLEVGRYFVEHTTSRGIARRVLQVGHEIQHVNQHRQNMGGRAQRHKREFLAFHWEATTTEATGTGRMQHSTRVALIDGAIGNYNCLTTAEKTTYDPQYQQLLTLRQTEQAASGHPATPVPTECSG